MRFAFISTMYGAPWGGSEELWSQAATQLKQSGHDVQASVVYWPRLSYRVTALAQHGIRLETYSSRQLGRARRIWNKLSLSSERSYKHLIRFSPDLVVISQGDNSSGFDWAKICREAAIPYVIIVHCNCDLWWLKEQIDDAVASYTAAYKVFCVSRNNLDLLRFQIGEALPNAGVAWNPYNVSPDPAPPWPNKIGWWRLASVARIELAAKGQDLLLRSLALPEWRNRPVRLDLFGSGADELMLRRMAELHHLDNVHFCGHVTDIKAIWEQSHMLVLPSRYEGLPLALVEAMWCGRPAVVTDVGGNAELCADDETGFVAEAATFSCFSDALERAWNRREEWQQLGQSARARAEQMIPKDPATLFCEQLVGFAGDRFGRESDN